MRESKFQNQRRIGRDLARAAFFMAGIAWVTNAGFAAADAANADAETGKAIQHANTLSRVFRAASGKVLPTVVTIRTSTNPRGYGVSDRSGGQNPFQGTPLEGALEDEFEGLGPRQPGLHSFRPRIHPEQGMGSGVIIDPSGVILTNHHVIDGADRVTVELGDHRRFKVTEIKFDKKTDLAVLRIKAEEKLPAAKLGDSRQLAIGDWVIAVGNPFQLGQTVSAGIISATGRSLRQGQWTNYLQTDAAINPGNSGGPLVNLDGEVVGINTAIASRSGGYQGIGFSIPSNTAKWVVEQLLADGKVQRAYLGVSIGEPDASVARKLGLRHGEGVLISEVFVDSPAAAAGCRPGDLIVSFAGQSTNGSRRLQSIVERCPMDSTQKIIVIRDGKKLPLSVVVKPLPDDIQSMGRGPSKRGGGSLGPRESFGSKMLGVEVSNLTDEIAKHLGYEGTAGVVITELDPRSIAAQVGLRAGAIILQVDRKPVKNIEQFETAIKNASLEEGILLLVRTGRGQRYIVLQSS